MFLCLRKKTSAIKNCIIIAKKAALDPDINPKNNTIINGKYFNLFFFRIEMYSLKFILEFSFEIA